MEKNKLIQSLSILSRREMTRFKEFAFSPYFNKHEDIRLLVAYLNDIYPHFTAERCHREVVFQALFPGELHDQNRLALIFTYTMRLLESFLIQEQHQEDEYSQQLLLLKSLRLRKQYTLYEKVLRSTTKQLDTIEQKDDRYYHWHYQLAAETDAFYNQMERRQTDHSIQRKQNNLDQFYLLEKLKDACEMHMRRRILNVDYATRMLEAVLRELHDNEEEYVQEPLILLYYQIYQMLTREDMGSYFTAIQSLQRYEYGVKKTELHYIYNYFQNYCIQRINKGDGRFLEEIFKLYKAQLKQGLLVEGDYLSEWHFKNIVTVAIRLNEMTWVKDFIEHYKSKLPPESQENAYRFNLASYHYAMRQYDQVLQLLLKVEYSDLRYSLGAKALLLRTYYDLEEYEALISLVQSFTLYLRRNKLMADSNREGHQNLFKFTRRSAQLRAKLGYENEEKLQKQLHKLKEDIDSAGPIFNKGWLLEKIQELELETVDK